MRRNHPVAGAVLQYRRDELPPSPQQPVPQHNELCIQLLLLVRVCIATKEGFCTL